MSQESVKQKINTIRETFKARIRDLKDKRDALIKDYKEKVRQAKIKQIKDSL